MGINQLDSTQSGPSKRRGLSLGVRIFALPLAILLFLIGITYFSLHRLGLVKSEIDHIAAYWLPAIELASEINEQALLQRVHYERVLRFYEYRPLPNGQIRRELQTRA
jgi:hypothetical protein